MVKVRMRNLTGQEFGDLIALSFAGRTRHGAPQWLCRCRCGIEKVIVGISLTSGATKSCGCKRAYSIGLGARRHGMTGTKVHNTWKSMIQRCTDQRADSFPRYGGRGITVCERWRTFENFYADMGAPPTLRHSIERRNNNGNYEPDNCCWATLKEQQNNRSDNRFMTIGAATMTIQQWADSTGVPGSRIRKRLDAGYEPAHALNDPLWPNTPGAERRGRKLSRPDKP